MNEKERFRCFQVLNEATFNRVVNEYFDFGFIIITSDRTCESELSKKKCSEEEIKKQNQINKQNLINIKRDIVDLGFSYIPVFGGYKEDIQNEKGEIETVDTPNPENSFIIPAIKPATRNAAKHEDLKDIGIILAQKYNQDSFLLKPPNNVDKNAYYVNKKGNIIQTFSEKSIGDMSNAYYTFLSKKNPKQRYTLTEKQKRIFFLDHKAFGMGDAVSRYGEILYNLDSCSEHKILGYDELYKTWKKYINS